LKPKRSFIAGAEPTQSKDFRTRVDNLRWATEDGGRRGKDVTAKLTTSKGTKMIRIQGLSNLGRERHKKDMKHD